MRTILKKLFQTKSEDILFLLLFVTFSYFFHLEPGWNVNSRIDLTYAIVDELSFSIDAYHNKPGFDTGDKAYNPHTGHFYSDKNIGLSLLGIIPYFLLKIITFPFGIETKPLISRYILTIFSVSLLSAYLGVIIKRLLKLFGAKEKEAFILAIFFSLGTLCLPYSTIFYPYQPSLLFFTSALYILVSGKFKGNLDNIKFFLPGFLCGLAMLFEYTCGIIIVIIWGYLLLNLKNKQKIIVFSLAILIPLIIFFVYNYICFGTPFTIPYKFLHWDFFRESMSRGFMGITGFRLPALYYITIHPYKGIFFFSPILILVFYGSYLLLKDRKYRIEAIISLIIIIFYLLFNASYYMWWGGWSAGARHLIPMLPFAFILLTPVIKKAKTLLIILGVISIIFALIPTIVDPQPKQLYPTIELLYPRFEYNYISPFFEEGTKQLLRGNVAYNAGKLIGLKRLYSLMPLFVLDILFIILLFKSIKSQESELS